MQPRPFLPYQVPAFEKLKSRRTVAMFYDMRLGKSLLTLRWLLHHRCRYALIVCPRLVMLAWQDECAAEGVHYHDWRKPKFDLLTTPGLHVCVINYEMLARRTVEQIGDFWDAIILDESTAIRNPKAKITKQILKRWVWVEHRAVLTGMPTPETFLDLWNQLAFVNGGEWMGCRNFYDWRFRNFYEAGYDWQPKAERLAAINDQLKVDAITLTKKQAGVGNAKVRSVHVVDAPPEISRASKRCLDEFALGDEETKWSLQVAIWLHKLSGGCHPAMRSDHKFKALRQLLDGGLSKSQGLIFCAYTSEVNAVVKWLHAHGIPSASLQGVTPTATRHRWIRMFKAGSIPILVCNAHVVRFGLDLSVADWAVYFSNTYLPEDRFQSEERGVHPLKTAPFRVIDIVTKGLVDERIRELLIEEKHLTARSFMSKLFVKLKTKGR